MPLLLSHRVGRVGRARARRGIASIWFAVIGLALAALFALVIDLSRYYFSFHQLQAAADSSVLAALDYLPQSASNSQTQAITVALRNTCDGKGVILLPNPSNDMNGDVVIGRYDKTTGVFTNDLTQPNAARVAARRTDAAHGGLVNLMFSFWSGSISGSSQTATATAFLDGPQPGLLLLDKYGRNPSKELEMQGGTNTDLVVNNGSIIVNSNDSDAADLHGTLFATSLATVGDVNTANNTTAPKLVKLSQPVPDPVAPFVAPLSPSEIPSAPTNTGSTLQPGPYLSGLPNTGGPYFLKPGVYVLYGPWMGSGISYSGADVTLYLMNSSGPHTFGNLNITAPTDPGDRFPNIAIYQDTASVPTSALGVTLTGTPNYNITGTIYMPYVDLTINGNTTISAFGSEVILNKLIVKGSASLTMNAVSYYQVIGTQRTIVK